MADDAPTPSPGPWWVLYLPVFVGLWVLSGIALPIAGVVHAVGHVVAARLLGIDIEVGLGIGPTLVRRGGWRWATLPGASVTAELEGLPPGKVAAYLASGPLATLLVGFGLPWLVLTVAAVSTGWREVVGSSEAEVAVVVEGGAAEAAGLREGDRILGVDGTPVTDGLHAVDLTRGSGGPVVVRAERAGEVFDVTLVPDPVRGAGFAVPAPARIWRHGGFFEAGGLAVGWMVDEAKRDLDGAIYRLTGRRPLVAPPNVTAPETTTRIVWSYAIGWSCMLLLALNLLPVPHSDLWIGLCELFRRQGTKLSPAPMVVGLPVAGALLVTWAGMLASELMRWWLGV